METKLPKKFEVLSLREAVRKRPSMYVGSTGVFGLHNLIFELVESSIANFLAGYGKNISVTIHADRSLTVADDGSGFPLQIAKGNDKPLAEWMMTEFWGDSMSAQELERKFWGTHTIDNLTAGVNFLSEWLRLEIKREGRTYTQDYQRGLPIIQLHQTGVTTQTGTKITFKPDAELFTTTEFEFDRIACRLEQKAALNKELHFAVVDERTEPKRELKINYPAGLVTLVKRLSYFEHPLHPEPISFAKPDTSDGISFEVALQYSNSFSTQVLSFVNQYETMYGGAHLKGLLTGLVQAIDPYVRERWSKDAVITRADLWEGLIAVISVYLPAPKLEGSTRQILASPIDEAVASFTAQALGKYFEHNPDLARKIAYRVDENYERRRRAAKSPEHIG